MTESTRLPSSPATCVENVLGPLDCARDASHARDNSQVRRVTGLAGGHYVKVAPKPILYTRETCAYRVAVPQLGRPEAARAVENTVAGLDKHLAKAGDHLPAAEADPLRHLVSTLSGCGPLPAGRRHGDFWEHNLLWNGSRLIDFKRSKPGPLVTQKPPPDCRPYTAVIFRMLTHGPSHQAPNWPTGGAR